MIEVCEPSRALLLIGQEAILTCFREPWNSEKAPRNRMFRVIGVGLAIVSLIPPFPRTTAVVSSSLFKRCLYAEVPRRRYNRPQRQRKGRKRERHKGSDQLRFPLDWCQLGPRFLTLTSGIRNPSKGLPLPRVTQPRNARPRVRQNHRLLHVFPSQPSD